MPTYSLILSMMMEADSKIEAMEILRERLGDSLEFSVSDEVDSDLFEELGIYYD
jgi:hypothetical protein